MNGTNEKIFPFTLKELNRNIKKIKDEEELYNDEKDKLKNLRKTISNSSNFNHNNPYAKNMDKCYKNCVEFCNNIMDYSNEAYFILENNIHIINQIIHKFEQELTQIKYNNFSYQNYMLDKNFDEMVNFTVSNKKKYKNKKNKITLNGLSVMKKKTGKSNKNKKNKATSDDVNKVDKRTSSYLNNLNLEDITYKEIDGKLDPNEPIYCFCNYVSYGDMIKCDNNKCPREWFHFHCVGLNSLPKGKWFCSKECAKQYQSKKVSN